jgi:hypothetical protein
MRVIFCCAFILELTYVICYYYINRHTSTSSTSVVTFDSKALLPTNKETPKHIKEQRTELMKQIKRLYSETYQPLINTLTCTH